MKQVHDIAMEALPTFASIVEFAKELTEMHVTGLWPKHAPRLNAFTVALAMEGYPPSQCNRIAQDYISMYAIMHLAKTPPN